MTRTDILKGKDVLTLSEFSELFNLDRSFVAWRITLSGILGYNARENVIRMSDKHKTTLQTANSPIKMMAGQDV